MDFMNLKLSLWLISKTFKKKHTHTHTHTNTKTKEEKYMLVIVWIVGLINNSTIDFTNVEFP